MSTADTIASFADEASIVVQVGRNLGEYRRSDDRESFERSLAAMGMGAEERAQFWDSMVPTSGNGTAHNGQSVDWSRVKCNTDLAAQLGILLGSNKYPRNLLLYRLTELQLSDYFAVQVRGSVHMGGKDSRGNPPQRRVVQFTKQPSREVREDLVGVMSVHRMLSGVAPSSFSFQVMQRASSLREVLGDDLGLRLTEALLAANMVVPGKKMAQELARVIAAGQSGRQITVVGAFCPDYAYEETGDPNIPYKYTFDGVGEGIGLVAQQFVRIVPVISNFLSELGISHRLVLGIGDFEADSAEILGQVRLDRAEFLKRCQRSLDRFVEAMPDDLPLQVEMFGEERSHGRLRQYAAEALTRLTAGSFGHMSKLHEGLQQILDGISDQYRTFYERWYGRDMDDAAVRRAVYEQGSEYAAVARIYQEDFGDDVLMLAGDRPEMHRFNALFTVFPTLCAKRAY